MPQKIPIQILIVHGGMTFKKRQDYLRFLRTRKISLKSRVKWTDGYLHKALGRGFQIIQPRMPLQDNAKYSEWKIYFQRHLALLGKKFILIGNSLGGIFLAKYLSENKLKQKALAVYLVCPPFDDTLPEEDLAGGFKIGRDLSLLEANCRNLSLFFSKDDDVVPVSHAKKYRAKLKKAKIVIYKSKNGHFIIPKFPEIAAMIKRDVNKV